MKLQVTYLLTISLDSDPFVKLQVTYLLTIFVDLLRTVREAAGDLLTYDFS